MKQWILSLVLCCTLSICTGQIKVLFVNDNKAVFENTDVMRSSLSAIDPQIAEISEFDAVEEGAVPSLEFLQMHDLVIWYTSTDGVGLWLWNGNDTDPDNLKDYMDEGGMLLLMGNDFLFDRYAAPPTSFVEGDFVYDYLGIKTYQAQSFGDDTGQGVPQMDYVENVFLENLPTPLTWRFETLWWADAVEVNDFGIPIYQMGPETYTLQGSTSGVLLRTTPNNFYPIVTLCFDPALIEPPTDRVLLMEQFLTYFRDFKLSLSTDLGELSESNYTFYPNPAEENLWISYTNSIQSVSAPTTFSIINSLGQVVHSSRLEADLLPFSVSIHHLQSGHYWMLISRDGVVDRVSFVKM